MGSFDRAECDELVARYRVYGADIFAAGCIDALKSALAEIDRLTATTIPVDLLPDVAAALYHQADLYRADKAHAPDDVVTLERDADRLDELASKLEHMATGP